LSDGNKKVEDSGCFILLICFLFPIVGFIIWATAKNDNPNLAKNSLKWGIIGIVFSLIFTIVIIFIAIGMRPTF